jgi:asparagine synthase (glutamine-hydrolysing)
MCGIAGVLNLAQNAPVSNLTLERMISIVRHRGPDGYGFFRDGHVGLAHARLSIIDLEGGRQPIYNEDRSLAVVFNGEIFNYIELRRELELRGHRFSTSSDTEVIVHLYEEKAEGCLQSLNGQFAIALYDSRCRRLFLARDRMGIRPLFYTEHAGRFYFGSEVKALFAADPAIPRAIDAEVLSEIFTFWTPAGEDTIFRGVRQLPPGHYAWVEAGREIQVAEYWDIPFVAFEEGSRRSEAEYVEEFRSLLIDAVRLQLRADVPVGAYLSGGLDSSAIASLVRRYTANHLRTFSVTFSDAVYDESPEQRAVADFLRTEHSSVHCTYAAVASEFPDVVWHGEAPILRTAPTPLFLLSRLVRESGYKVVLTGEGADELLGGYDIFKEAKIRAFVHRNTSSRFRSLLFKRLYPYLALSPTRSAEYAKAFFDSAAEPEGDPFYAHRPRWKTTGRTRQFLSKRVRAGGADPEAKLERLRGRLEGLDYFSRAQYLESKLLLGNYLLSSQGDRMAMAHSVEGRFPFLDHRVVELACRVPPTLRMRALTEKNVLKRAARGLLPDRIVDRKKQPYMAPDILAFFGDGEPEYLDRFLSGAALADADLFDPDAVEQLRRKCRKGARQGFMENMAFVGILSTQILHERFVKSFPDPRTPSGTSADSPPLKA